MQDEVQVCMEVRSASEPPEQTDFKLVGGAKRLGAWDLTAAASTILP